MLRAHLLCECQVKSSAFIWVLISYIPHTRTRGDAGKLCCGAWRARLHWPADNELLATVDCVLTRYCSTCHTR